MSHFGSESTLIDVLNDEKLKRFSDFFYYRFPKDIYKKRIDDTSWYARDAINWFYDRTIECKTDIFYTAKNTNIIHITHQSSAKFAFIVSGGGFRCIDTAHEGIAIGKELYNLGYDVFLLTYRLGKDAKLNNTTKDINNAVSYICKNKKQLSVNSSDFLLIGGSAGAYVAASYCSNNRGYNNYHNPKPKCLCLLYPIIDFHVPENNIKEIVIGDRPSNYLINKYSVINHIRQTFPPTFIVHCKDDDCVPYSQSVALFNELKENKIPSKLLLCETGKHGWGIGKKLEPEIWFESFLDFIKNL